MYLIKYYKSAKFVGCDTIDDINEAKELARMYVDRNVYKFAQIFKGLNEEHYYQGTHSGYLYTRVK